MSSAFILMDSLMTMSFFKAALASIPFMMFLSLSTYMTLIPSKMIQRIELIENSANEIADEVLIQNLRGEQEIIKISMIKPLDKVSAKKVLQTQ